MALTEAPYFKKPMLALNRVCISPIPYVSSYFLETNPLTAVDLARNSSDAMNAGSNVRVRVLCDRHLLAGTDDAFRVVDVDAHAVDAIRERVGIRRLGAERQGDAVLVGLQDAHAAFGDGPQGLGLSRLRHGTPSPSEPSRSRLPALLLKPSRDDGSLGDHTGG